MSASEPLVCLQHGFVVPAAVFNLVLDCERAGIRLSVRAGEVLDVEGPHTPQLLSELKRWKRHVLAILKYTADDRHLFDDLLPVPQYGPIQQVNK